MSGIEVKIDASSRYYQAPQLLQDNQYVPTVDFMFNLISYWPGINRAIREDSFFKDQIVVDLGAGKENWAFHMAIRGDAAGYIAVEPQSQNISTLCYRVKEINRCWAEIVQEDIATFLPRLPNASVSFIISALSCEILTDRNSQFFDTVKSQISRTLAKNGSILWYGSDERFLSDPLLKSMKPEFMSPVLYKHNTKSVIDRTRFLFK
jgi:hypothetical protein